MPGLPLASSHAQIGFALLTRALDLLLHLEADAVAGLRSQGSAQTSGHPGGSHGSFAQQQVGEDRPRQGLDLPLAPARVGFLVVAQITEAGDDVVRAVLFDLVRGEGRVRGARGSIEACKLGFMFEL